MGNRSSNNNDYSAVPVLPSSSTAASPSSAIDYTTEPNFQALFDKHKNYDLADLIKILIEQYGSVNATMTMHTFDSGVPMLTWLLITYVNLDDNNLTSPENQIDEIKRDSIKFDNDKRIELFQLLLENGARTNKTVCYSKTILPLPKLTNLNAANFIKDCKIQYKVVNLLIKHGLDVTRKVNSKGATVLEYYIKNKNYKSIYENIYDNINYEGLYVSTFALLYRECIAKHLDCFKDIYPSILWTAARCKIFATIFDAITARLDLSPHVMRYSSDITYINDILKDFYDKNEHYTSEQKVELIYNFYIANQILVKTYFGTSIFFTKIEAKLSIVKRE